MACPVRMGGTFGGAVRVLTARPSRVPVSAARGASRRPWTVAVAPGPRRSGDSGSSDWAHRGASRARDVVVGAVADPRGTGVEDDANVGTPAKAAPANGRGRGARGRGARGRGGSRVPSPLRNFASLSPEDVRAAAAIVDAFDAALRRGDLEGCVAAVGADDESSGASDEDDDEGRWVGATRGGDDDRRRPAKKGGNRRNRRALMREVGRRLNPAHKQFLGACKDARRLDLALRYAQSLPPNPRLYSSVLGACAQAKDHAAAVAAFDLYSRHGLAPDAFAYSGLISAAGKCGDLRSAEAALRRAVTEGACDQAVMNAYVDACARMGLYDEAKGTVDAMRDAGQCAANVRTYNSLITAAARAGNLRAAQDVLAEIDADEDITPTDRTYGAALSAAANDGGTRSAENVRWALEVYRRASEAGMGANNHAVSSLLTTLARGVAAGSWSGDDAVERAGSILATLVEGEGVPGSKVPNAAVWSAFMSVCARAGRAKEALGALRLMRTRGYPLEPYTLASALTACRGANAPREEEEALEVFESAPPEASATTAVRNAAIALYAARGRADRAFALYEEMRAEGANAESFLESNAPDTITYNTLIAACVASNKSARASALLKDMIAAGVPRSERTYVSLMASASRTAPEGEGAAAAARVFAEAEADDTTGPANEFIYTALIDAQSKGGDPNAAFETYGKMKAAGVSPTVVTFGCLLNACRHFASSGAGESDVDPAELAYALLSEMSERGVVPNDRCQNALVRVVSEAGRIDDMLDEVKAIARRRGKFERTTLEGVVRALCRASYAERALRILSWMDVRGYSPSAPTYRALVQVCATEGQVQWAWTLHQRMRRLGYRPDRPTCSALTQALCRAAVATDSGEARGMLRRAIEAFERAAVTGVAAEGEGETNAWDEDDERTSPTGMTVEQEIASMEDQSNWDAVGDWSLENDAPVALGPACPLKGEVAAAAEAKAKKGKVPPEEVLSPGAIRSLIAAAARTGELKFALKLYRSPGGRAALKPARVRGESGNAEDGGARREVFEVMCEACCHEGLVDVALEVFDDVKAYDVRVSKVTLAFLEACCRRSKVPEWRVFDVCAQLRHQVTAKKQARLAAQMPAKSRSHHVYGVVDSADSSDEDDVDASIPPATITTSSSSSSATAAFVQDDVGGERRRRKDVEDKWERARRERSRDRARGASADSGGGENLDLAWLKFDDPYGDDPYGDYDSRDRRAGGEEEMDPLQAELRTEGLGRGNRQDPS